MKANSLELQIARVRAVDPAVTRIELVNEDHSVVVIPMPRERVINELLETGLLDRERLDHVLVD